MGFLSGSVGKESACNAGDLSLIPALGRPLGENVNSFQHSCLENSKAEAAYSPYVAKSQIQLSS